MKKTYVAALATLSALVIVLAAAVALIQYQPSQSGSGTLAIAGTDPPMAANGVQHANMHYSSASAHKAGSDMSSGWVQLSGSGSMDLMAQGSAKVLATSHVDAATYDAFRFNVDSIDVVYQGANYTATVASSTVTATSQSRVQVNSSSSATALVDVRTIIQNTGTTSNPQFVFTATAVATNVPPQASASLTLQVGATVDLTGQAWYTTFQSETSAKVDILTATLTSGSLKLSLQNSGGASGQVNEIIITPVSSSTFVTTTLPSSLSGSAVFTVDGSGTVQQTSSLQATALASAGSSINSGASSTLSYTGNIAMSGSIQGSGIVSGQQYIITCIGADTYASTTVVAS